jgi:hypothetical protein
MNQFPPGPLVSHLRVRQYSQLCFFFITGVVYTGDKLFTDNDDTGNNLSPVTTTPAMKQLEQYSACLHLNVDIK